MCRSCIHLILYLSILIGPKFGTQAKIFCSLTKSSPIMQSVSMFSQLIFFGNIRCIQYKSQSWNSRNSREPVRKKNPNSKKQPTMLRHRMPRDTTTRAKRGTSWGGNSLTCLCGATRSRRVPTFAKCGSLPRSSTTSELPKQPSHETSKTTAMSSTELSEPMYQPQPPPQQRRNHLVKLRCGCGTPPRRYSVFSNRGQP